MGKKLNIFEKKACKQRGNPYLESLSKILWRSPYRLARSRTLDFHSKNRGSNPRGDARGLRKNEAARKRGFFLFGLRRVRGWNFCDSKNPQGKRSAVQFHDFARGLRKNEAARKRGFFCSDCGAGRGWNFCDSKNPQGKRSAVQFHDFARGLRKNEAAESAVFFCSDCGAFGDGIFAPAKVSCGISR